MVYCDDYRYGQNIEYYLNRRSANANVKSDYDRGRKTGRDLVMCGALGALAMFVFIKLKEK